jgi:hypothetical protein
MSVDKRPRPGGAAPAGKSHLAGYSARPSGPAWERRGHDHRRNHRRRRPPSPRRRWLVAGAIGVLVLLAGGLIAVIANLAEDEPDTVDLGPTTTLDPSTLSAEGQELYALVEASEAATYHVGFGVESETLASAGAAAQLEVWRQADSFREHQIGVDASGSSTTVNIVGPDGAMTCGGGVGAPPTCTESQDADSAITTALATIIAQLPDGDTVVADETIANVPARCFTTTAGEAVYEACLSADGIPLRIDDGSIRLEAALVETTVPPEVLVVPAVGAEPSPAVTLTPPVPPAAAPTTTAPGS